MHFIAVKKFEQRSGFVVYSEKALHLQPQKGIQRSNLGM